MQRKASVVSPLTALYPVVTAACAVLFLGEAPIWTQYAGAGVALVAAVLLAR